MLYGLLLLLTLRGMSQSAGLHRVKVPTKQSVDLGFNSIVPGSVQVSGYDTSYFKVDDWKARLDWKRTVPVDSVWVQYRTFGFSLGKPYYRYNYDSIKDHFLAFTPIDKSSNTHNKTVNDWLDQTGLQYSGSFGRSMSVGNRQDAVFNSQLNLQLSGFIADSIQVAAAITDNNIPVQPDGTTAQLNEFDKILLQFKKQRWEVQMGDIDVRERGAAYLRFYKRMQGVVYNNSWGKEGAVTVAAGLGKGKFNRFVLQVQEGNQGPYRLPAANGELYFIVLANTEKVFMDGEQLQRGEDKDYVINYNTAEITFTPKRLVSRDKRIQVEFEYSDRNYLNTVLYGKAKTQVGAKIVASFQAYQSADAASQPINQNLDSSQKRFLYQLGDSIQQAFYPIYTTDTFSSGKIMYAKINNPNGSNDSIFVYSTNTDSARYVLSFVNVGAGNGNYAPYYNNANGKVYQYVPPQNGIKQGSYEPAQYLVTPKLQQLMGVDIRYQLSKHTYMQVQAAASNYDVNRLSAKDKSDNKGGAFNYRLHYGSTMRMGNKQWHHALDADYEYVHQRFVPVERLRNVEFYRDWGLALLPDKQTEQLTNVQWAVNDSSAKNFKIAASAFTRADGFKAWKQQVLAEQTAGKCLFKIDIHTTQVNGAEQKGNFTKPEMSVQLPVKWLRNSRLQAGVLMEQNQQRYRQTDSLLPTSFQFTVVSAGIASNAEKQNKWSFNYFTRADALPQKTALVHFYRSHNYQLQADWLSRQVHQLRWNISFRKVNVSKAGADAGIKAAQSLLSRLEYRFMPWKGLVNGSSFYEMGAGQEQKKDFSYLEVQQGRGQYTWIDYNKDGIQQLNEFELAAFADQARYVRVYTATNEFVQTHYAQLNYQFTVNPKVLFAKPHLLKGWRKWLSVMQWQSNLQTTQKVLAGGALFFNPFQRTVADTALISTQQNYANTFSINRYSAVWGMDVAQVFNTNKSLLTYGFESRTTNEYSVKMRYTVKRLYTVEWLHKWQYLQLNTPAYANRNYDIAAWITEPKITFTRHTALRSSLAFQWANKQNALGLGGEKTTIQSVVSDSKINLVQRLSLNAKLTYSNIQYTGISGSTVGYLLLDGLTPGKNYLWMFDLTRQLKNGFQIGINYEGRKTAVGATVHLGRATVRAIL